MEDKINEMKALFKKLNKTNKVFVKTGKVTLRGSLDLRYTNITKLPDNLTVEGNLDIRHTDIIELPNNLTIRGSLDLRHTNITKLPDNLTIGGSLDLNSANIAELPDNLTVGRSLDLGNTNITKLPDNLTVGGSLYLNNTNITELPDTLTVEGWLYGASDDIANIKQLLKGYNKELKYIYFDGILWGNVKSVKKVENITIYKTPLGYCVVEDELSAHGKTLKEAMADLTFKKLRTTNKSEIVKEIKKTGKVNKVQYRAITGACQMGTERFCQQHNITVDEISLEDLRKIYVDDYRAKEFWELVDEK